MMDTPDCKSAKAMASEGDRISGLPDEMLHHVMSFLPAMDTVRTCVLSPRWRHLWATARSLNINAKGFTTQGGFINFVTTLLLRRGCAPLESFVLHATESHIILQNFCDIANLWISHALWCKVRELTIVNYHGGTRRAGFRLHHHLFTSKYLKRLHLVYVRVDSPLLNTLLSGCMALEDLNLMACEERHYSRQIDMRLCQMMFTNLTTLTLSDWCLRNDCKVLLRMLQRSPNLEILTLELPTWSHGAAAETDALCEGTTTPFSCEKLKKIEICCSRGDKGAGIVAKLLYANIISPPEIKFKLLCHTWAL